MLTLEQLTTPVTEDEALETILEILTELGFQATSWQSGSIQLVVIRLFARVWSKVTDTITAIARGGFTTLAGNSDGTRSPYLTLLAKYVYDLERVEPQPTIGTVLLTSSAGAPVHTWAAGDIIVADAEEGVDGANAYTCLEGGTLGPNSTIQISFQANVAGAGGNIVPSTPLFLWTPLVGVTATNPALLPDSNTWITTPGQDEESDTRLIARCMARWSRLSYGNIDGAYIGWALEALPALTRVNIDSAPGDGSVTIIGATDLGPIDAGQIQIIEDYVNGITDGVGRRPINDIVNAVGATVINSPALSITAYVLSNELVTASSAITAALLNYLGTIPIGGVRLSGTQGRVLYSALVAIAQKQTGVRSVEFSISEDILLNASEIYTPPITVTVLPVAPGV